MAGGGAGRGAAMTERRIDHRVVDALTERARQAGRLAQILREEGHRAAAYAMDRLTESLGERTE